MGKGISTLIGFILLALGFVAIILSLVGVQFSFLTWADDLGRLTGFVIKLLMIIVGIIMMIVSQSNFSGELESKEK